MSINVAEVFFFLVHPGRILDFGFYFDTIFFEAHYILLLHFVHCLMSRFFRLAIVSVWCKGSICWQVSAAVVCFVWPTVT